jgi:hypothetical protein
MLPLGTVSVRRLARDESKSSLIPAANESLEYLYKIGL